MAKFSGLILSGVLFLGATSVVNAQTGPAGAFDLHVSDAPNLVWDLSAFEVFNTVSIDVEDSKADGAVYLHFPATPVLGSAGGITGGGNTAIEMEYESDSGWTTLNFNGTYKLTASISSSKGLAKGSMSASIAATTPFEGATRKLKASNTSKFTINNTSKSVTGTYATSASASGLGGLSEKGSFSDSTLPDGSGDGTWMLTMQLTTTGKVVSGTEARVQLNSGRTLTFTPKGTFTAKTDATKLVLTGTGTAKGSSLQIGMVGSQIKTVKGKLLGQTISVTR